MPLDYSSVTLTLDTFAPADSWNSYNEKGELVFEFSRDNLMMKHVGRGIVKEIKCGRSMFEKLTEQFPSCPTKIS